MSLPPSDRSVARIAHGVFHTSIQLSTPGRWARTAPHMRSALVFLRHRLATGGQMPILRVRL